MGIFLWVRFNEKSYNLGAFYIWIYLRQRAQRKWARLPFLLYIELRLKRLNDGNHTIGNDKRNELQDKQVFLKDDCEMDAEIIVEKSIRCPKCNIGKASIGL